MVAEIKALCEKNNTSIKELERELGLGNGTIRRWDDKIPSVDKALLVANYFHVPLSDLVGGLPDKKSPTQERVGPKKRELLDALERMETSDLLDFIQKATKAIQRRNDEE